MHSGMKLIDLLLKSREASLIDPDEGSPRDVDSNNSSQRTAIPQMTCTSACDVGNITAKSM